MTYLDVNGHPTWVTDEGAGDPVLVLHGGYSNSDITLPPFVERLGNRYRVVGFDRRGHGRTADTDAPFHYESMTDETIGVLEAVVGGAAHVVGYSDGGIIALHLARRRPDLVRSMVLIGTNYHADGLLPDWLGDEEGSMALVAAMYGAISPDGIEHFPIVEAKEVAMYTSEPTMTVDDMRTLAMPTLVLVGDDDAMSLAHTVSLYESLPNAQLAVVPGASHLVPIEKPTLVAQLADDFLSTGGAVTTMLPIRRRR